jgi:hypothetical protein
MLDTYPDEIDDVEIEFDENGAFLILHGDFERTFRRYMDDENKISVKLAISETLMQNLVDDIRRNV